MDLGNKGFSIREREKEVFRMIVFEFLGYRFVQGICWRGLEEDIGWVWRGLGLCGVGLRNFSRRVELGDFSLFFQLYGNVFVGGAGCQVLFIFGKWFFEVNLLNGRWQRGFLRVVKFYLLLLVLRLKFSFELGGVVGSGRYYFFVCEMGIIIIFVLYWL